MNQSACFSNNVQRNTSWQLRTTIQLLLEEEDSDETDKIEELKKKQKELEKKFTELERQKKKDGDSPPNLSH